MAKHVIKLNGTSANSFQVGFNGATISSEEVTSPYSLTLPPALGTEGQALLLDSSGNLVFGDVAADITEVPYISWIATDGQTIFTDANLALYTDESQLTVFRNGVLMRPEEYTLSGDTLTISTYLPVDDEIEIPSRGVAGGSGGGGGGVAGIGWANTAAIAVGDIFAGQTQSMPVPGSTFTPTSDRNMLTTINDFSAPSSFSINAVYTHPVTGTIIVIGNNGGTPSLTRLLRSTDDGYTWTEITTTANVTIYGLTGYQRNGQSCWIAVGISGGTIITSTDDGLTWTTGTTGSLRQCYSVTYSPSLDLILMAGGGGAYTTAAVVSADGGATWVERTWAGAPNQTSRAVIWSERLQLFMLCVGSTIMTSPDSINWTARTAPSTGYTFAETPTAIISGGYSAYFMKSTDGINWTGVQMPNSNSAMTIAYDPQSDSILLGSNQFFYSFDGGTTWKRSVLNGSVSASNSITAAKDGSFLAGGSVWLYRSRPVTNSIYTSVTTKVPQGTYKCLGMTSNYDNYSRTYGSLWTRIA